MENALAPTPKQTAARFKKGQSGNPLGRPKGSKNKITIMKLALELNLRKQLENDAHEILRKAIELAKNGDQAMIKLLVDKMVPTSKAMEDEPTKEKVQIFIDRLPERGEVNISGRKTVDNGDTYEG